MGESAEMHAHWDQLYAVRSGQHDALQDRMAHLEAASGGAFEKRSQWEEMSAKHAQLQEDQDVSFRMQHSAMQDRLALLEKQLSESAEKRTFSEFLHGYTNPHCSAPC